MEKHTHIIEDEVKSDEIDTEDGGDAKIVALCQKPEDKYGMFIHLKSWDEERKHEEFNKFIGRKIRIIIETID